MKIFDKPHQRVTTKDLKTLNFWYKYEGFRLPVRCSQVVDEHSVHRQEDLDDSERDPDELLDEELEREIDEEVHFLFTSFCRES